MNKIYNGAASEYDFPEGNLKYGYQIPDEFKGLEFSYISHQMENRLILEEYEKSAKLLQCFSIIHGILNKYPHFNEYRGLKSLDRVSGFYIIFIRNSHKIFIESSENIGAAICHEWFQKTNEDISRIFEECQIYVYKTKHIPHDMLDNMKELIPEEIYEDSYMEYLSPALRGEGNIDGGKKMDKRSLLEKVNQLDKKKCAIIFGGVGAAFGSLVVARKILKRRG